MRVLFLGTLFSITAMTSAADSSSSGIEFFERKIRPLFAENCYSCHGEEKQKAKLRLDSPAAIRVGSEGGPIFVPDKPDQSKIILAVSYTNEDLKMPPKKRLSEKQVADLLDSLPGLTGEGFKYLYVMDNPEDIDSATIRRGEFFA